jgi:hypothetical protein
MAKIWIVVAGVGLVALLVASVVVAVLEREEPFEAGTAEATVQAFLRAIEDDEFETVYGLLSADLREDCLAEQVFGFPYRYRDQFNQNRITLERTNEVGGVTLLTVRISSFERDGPFGSSENSFLQRYALRQTDDQWRFVEFPWPLFHCGQRKLAPPPPVEPDRDPDNPRPEPAGPVRVPDESRPGPVGPVRVPPK